MTAEWIARLADNERKRDDARSRVSEAAARKAHQVAVHGPRLIDELRETVVRDIDAFRSEFHGDFVRQIQFEADAPEGGFAVHKREFPTVALSVAPHLAGASVSCQYRFTPAGGLPPREDRVELVFSSDTDGDTVQMKHQGTGQVFPSADALSEYLLVPVFTGRPR